MSPAAGVVADLRKSFDRHQVRSLLDIAVPSIVFGVSWPFRADRGGVADLMDRTSTFATHRRPEVLLSHWQERRHALADALGNVLLDTLGSTASQRLGSDTSPDWACGPADSPTASTISALHRHPEWS